MELFSSWTGTTRSPSASETCRMLKGTVTRPASLPTARRPSTFWMYVRSQRLHDVAEGQSVHRLLRSGGEAAGMTRLIALTGYAGSGKSTVARHLVEAGFEVLATGGTAFTAAITWFSAHAHR